MSNQPKFQVWKAPNRPWLHIVNTQPIDGKRWAIVGKVINAKDAIEYCKALNRQSERLGKK